MLCCNVNEHEGDCDVYFQDLCFAYKCREHKLQEAAFYLVLFRLPPKTKLTPEALIRRSDGRSAQQTAVRKSYDDYTIEFEEHRHTCWHLNNAINATLKSLSKSLTIRSQRVIMHSCHFKQAMNLIPNWATTRKGLLVSLEMTGVRSSSNETIALNA